MQEVQKVDPGSREMSPMPHATQVPSTDWYDVPAGHALHAVRFTFGT